MAGELKNILKVACLYVTTIIGAGFASGQEIARFFTTYHNGGYYGIIFSGLLFSIIGYLVLDKVYTQRIRNYDEFIFPTVGWFAGWIMQVAVSLFMLSVFSIMIAGLGSILCQKTGMAYNYAVVLVAFVCALVIMTGMKGLMALSTVTTPILIFGIIIIGSYVIIGKDTAVFSMAGSFKAVTDNWFFSSILYVSYNSIMSIVVMCNMLPYLKTRRVGKAGGIAGGVVLCIIALILNTAIFMFYPDSMANELPVLGIVLKYSNAANIMYALVLALAMFSSAAASGYCFIDRIKGAVPINSKLLTMIVAALVIPLSSMGFANLISILYPAFGYIGLFTIFAILLHSIGFKINKRNNKITGV